jgi:hypothetical protein
VKHGKNCKQTKEIDMREKERERERRRRRRRRRKRTYPQQITKID